ncbi:unnamed protein product [Rotaria sp. Silwood2]|nr:unnamed protein product [Rotaria sp. Silwood2]
MIENEKKISDFQYDASSCLKTSKPSTERVPLTGITDIDEPLYELIDLFVRDYIEIWYKTQLSSEESFIDDVKNGIYTTIRHLSERLREIDWLEFCTGTIVDSFATHVRLYRKAKERLRLEQSTDIRSCFFDLEAEYERGICRDEVCMDKDKEKEFLRDIVEVLIYILLPANEFRCVPARVLLREVAVNLGLIPFIDMYSDPDAINQLIINMCQQIPLTIDNFLLVVRTTDSKAELSTLVERLDIEISRWRSKDTGGENDADIRATLNSYQYLKKLLSERLDTQNRTETIIFDDDDILPKVSYRELPLAEILNNCNGLDYFLKFLHTLDAVGYGNFYLNAEAFRCAGQSASQQNANFTYEQQQANKEILRNMAKDLIEQYFLSTVSVCCEKGEKYAIYVISVYCKSLHSNNDDQRREWITYRRFSEFNDLHMTIKKRFPALRDFINLPNKSFINNTSQEIRLKRQKELNDYLITLVNPKVLQNNPGLTELVLKFLRNQQWKHEQTELARKMDTLSNPFKQASMGIAKGVSKIGGGLTIVSDTVVENAGKIFRTNANNNNRMNIKLSQDAQTFSIVEETQAENAKNIPLRVLLVIMDEVFDLKQKNMWFRSRFVSILKRFLRAFMGDSVNRRIATFVQHWTSAKKIAKEIIRFKENLWPNGIQADKSPERDAGVRNITQVICKAKLLGIVSDELRHIIGSETTRRGLLRLFELLQNETLNRRFVYIVIEALLIKLFRPNDLHLILEKLYSQSERVKEEYRRRIFEQENNHSGVIVNNQHYGESNPRPYYLNRLSVRNDDNISFQRSSSVQQQTILSRSLSKISR